MGHARHYLSKKEPHLEEILDKSVPITLVAGGERAGMSLHNEVPIEVQADDIKLSEIGKYGELKRKVLDLFENEDIFTLSEAARCLKVSKLLLWKLKREDSAWAALVNEAKEVFNDRLEQEILEPDLKYPQVLARMFLLKGGRPAIYRDAFKIEVGSPKVVQLLEDLKNAGTRKKLREAEEALKLEEGKITPDD